MHTKSLVKIKSLLSVFTFVFIFFFSGYFVSEAASLRINSNSSTISVGSTMTFSVLVNSGGVAVNNAEGVIKFSPEFFSVTSVSKSGSVFSLWVEEPSFSNSSGTISFNGGVPTPGFTGASGRVISFTVKAKKAGQASFSFDSASVRANDGLGTDVLSSKSGTTIEVTTPTKKEVEPVKESKPKPETKTPIEAPVIIPAIVSSPQVSLSAENIYKGGSVTVFGKSDYPGEHVNLTLKSNGKLVGQHSLQVSPDGFFSIMINKVKVTGTIDISAQNVLSGGEVSEFSSIAHLTVTDKNLVKLSVNIFWIITLLVFILILGFVAFLGWYKYLALKKI